MPRDKCMYPKRSRDREWRNLGLLESWPPYFPLEGVLIQLLKLKWWDETF